MARGRQKVNSLHFSNRNSYRQGLLRKKKMSMGRFEKLIWTLGLKTELPLA